MAVTLALLKAHLRILHDSEDELLDAKLATARGHVQSYIGRTLDEIEDGDEDFPPALDEAVLLLVAHLYEHRSALTEATLSIMPMGFYELVGPHRRWVF